MISPSWALRGTKVFGRFSVLAVSGYMAPIGLTPKEPPEGRPERASRRIKVTLPESLAQKLDKLASRAGEPPAKVAAQMIRQAVADAETGGSARRERTDDDTRRDDNQPSKRSGRPPWLERLAPMDRRRRRPPREELAFQAQLANYGHILRQTGGSIKLPWQPGAPPIEWS